MNKNRELEINAHIGKRMRDARLKMGLSQTEIGNELGISFQQVQKYENGSNRMTAARLYLVSRILGKPFDWFFEELYDDVATFDLRASVTRKIASASKDKLAAVNTLLSA